MSLLNGKKPKFLRKIEEHNLIYEKKNLKYVKNKWIFYWRFLAHLVDTGYRHETIIDYYSVLKRFLIWINKKSLRKINKNNIGEYLLYLKNERHYKPYILKYPKEKIGMFFKFVMRFSRIKVNPTANLNVRVHYKQQENMDYFNQDEIKMVINKPLKYLKRLKKSDFETEYGFKKRKYTIKRDYLILKLMFSTGIRPCEIVNIELDDFNPVELKIRIHSKGNQQYIMKDRHVYISQKTVEEIQELIKLQEQDKIRKEKSKQKLFIHYKSWRMKERYPDYIVKYWALLCGIRRRIYAYMIRYTYCTRLIENGIDIYSLKRLMGHKDLAVTLKHYFKLTRAEMRKEWKQFNPIKGVNL